jgi:hypothetical protein
LHSPLCTGLRTEHLGSYCLVAKYRCSYVMSSPKSRLSKLASHFAPSSSSASVVDLSHPYTEYNHHHNSHTLSPTYFLPRAAAIEPEVPAPSTPNIRLGILYMSADMFCLGFGNIPCHIKRQGIETDVWRICRSCKRTGILLEEAWFQEGRNTGTQYTGVS